MARSKRMSVQKRLREKKKAEEANLKREMKSMKRGEPDEGVAGNTVASRDDLEGYGIITEPESETESP